MSEERKSLLQERNDNLGYLTELRTKGYLTEKEFQQLKSDTDSLIGPSAKHRPTVDEVIHAFKIVLDDVDTSYDKKYWARRMIRRFRTWSEKRGLR